MEPEGSVTRSQEPTIGPCLEPDEYSSHINGETKFYVSLDFHSLFSLCLIFVRIKERII